MVDTNSKLAAANQDKVACKAPRSQIPDPAFRMVWDSLVRDNAAPPSF